jgi:hypothetical protein
MYESKSLAPKTRELRVEEVVLTYARHNQMQSTEHPALCEGGRAEDSESQHPYARLCHC